MSALRTFIAVKLRPARPIRQVLETLGSLGRAVRTVEPDNLHLTLRFLGPTEPDDVPVIEADLRDAVSAAKASPFDLTLNGLGAFPDSVRPNVIWIGCIDAEPLTRIEAPLSWAGESQSRKFHPHLTLARINRRRGGRCPQRLIELLESHKETSFGTQPITAVHIYTSKLEPTGATYTRLASVTL